jgi:hypothetical protein
VRQHFAIAAIEKSQYGLSKKAVCYDDDLQTVS